MIDVTEREKADQEPRDRGDRLRAILDAAIVAIVTIDLRGTIIDVNPATERIFGYKEDELLGQNVKMLMPPPYRDEHDGYLARYHETGEAHIIGIGREVRARRKDGSTFPVDLSVSRVPHMGLFTGIIRDITDRKRAEEELRQQHELTENLIESAQGIILVLDLQGRVARLNPAFEQLSGWSLEEARGRDWFETFLPACDRTRTRQLFNKAVIGERTRGNISSILTKDGGERKIIWNDAPLTDADGRIVGLLCTGIDVTERLALEKEVYAAVEEEKLRTAHELHDGLVSQLTGIGMSAQLLREKLTRGLSIAPSEITVIAEHIHETAIQARELSHGLYPVADHPSALAEQLNALVARIQTRSEPRCRFESCHGPIEIADTLVANHLYRIAQEAVQNALKYSGAADLVVRLAKDADGSVHLTIEDNGCGFDPDEPDKRKGIGLHTMSYRAHAIGGSLHIESVIGKGTRITCRCAQENGGKA